MRCVARVICLVGINKAALGEKLERRRLTAASGEEREHPDSKYRDSQCH